MRKCGECIACCVYPKIEDKELTKKGLVHCPNLKLSQPIKKDEMQLTGLSCKGNCKIYKKRPNTCERYKCAWILGHGDENDRPDKSFILFDCSHQIENALEAKPLRDGEESTPEGRAVINRMSASFGVPVIVLSFYERNIKRIVGHGIISWLL